VTLFSVRVTRPSAALRSAPWVLLALCFALARPAAAQQVFSRAEQVITVARGASALLVNPVPIARVTLGDPAIAEANVVSPTEIVINGKQLGTTTMLSWDRSNQVRVYSVEVTADAPALQRQLRALLPGEQIDVTSSGNTVTLSGTVKESFSATRAMEIARTTGATVVDNLYTPPAEQVLLKVRFAEINRSILKNWAVALSTLNPQDLNTNGDWSGSTSSDGVVEFLLQNPNANIEALIRASKQSGDFRSLAEPNLMALPGKEAYFLAGGEFPFPTLQAGQTTGGITIVFKDFGIKLRYTANVLRSGAIRLKLAPEVSSLDFANGITIGGFQIPTILSRRAETEVELRPGQYLAIAGLMDNNMLKNVTKIPLLGDIPILGELFRSREVRQGKRELLVLITPELVTPTNRATPLPTGEPGIWGQDGHLRKQIVPPQQQAPAATPAPAPTQRQ